MTVARNADETHQVGQFGWLVNNFADSVPGVAHAVVVSVDGLLLTSSERLPVDRAEQMSAISAGIVSLNLGAAKCLGADQVVRTVVEMDQGALLLTSIKDGSCLAVLASHDCDISQVAYEMTVLVDQVGQLLTPQLRAALAAS
ncbi:MAG: roadblock/LC7 domain-containing protein [Actinophytocola sp.]|uniref:roadblock/LC7 domain-containing protein n=1 Tax=Actinophytocola sp. TaxID=1872138 RepID=UPI0013297B50|nr:roadblock/LC7 domain-containing protein [Actinophytocola sp.]MPZ82599.1 roadblock/LC7 domain-containing protein [Actinophytocola sp.]